MRPTLLVPFLLLSASQANIEDRQYSNIGTIPLTNNNIRPAIRFWYDTDQNSPTLVEATYGGPIESWDISAVTSLEEAFLGLDYFDADLSQWDTSGITNMRAAFYNTTGFAGQVGSWDVSNVVDMRVLLSYSSDFQDDISQWNTASLQNLRAAFTEYSSTDDTADTLPISTWQTPNLLDMEGAFAGTRNFQTDLTGWDTSRVTSMALMLERTVNFYGGDLSLLDTSNVVTMEGMFQDATNVRNARKISEWDTTNVVDMHRIFFNTSVVYDDETPDDVFIFHLCWDLSALEAGTLSEAFCHGSAGGFDCDCVPDDIVESINSECSDSKQGKHCYGSLNEEQLEEDVDPETEKDFPGADLVFATDSGAISHRMLQWGAPLLSLCLGLASSIL